MRSIAFGLTVAFLVLAGGCPPENYPALVGTTLEQVNAIRNDNTLSAQEQRTQLEALGLHPLTVNALLRDQTLANQFGGDLRSAYEKVVAPNFTALTPDETQIYAREASAVDDADDLDVSLDDIDAQDLVDFFDEFDIGSPDKLQAFLDAGGTIPGDTLPDVVPALFIDFDPDLLIPVLP